MIRASVARRRFILQASALLMGAQLAGVQKASAQDVLVDPVLEPPDITPAPPPPPTEPPAFAPHGADAELPTFAFGGFTPIQIKIPSIGLNARIVPVGLDADGSMAAPTNPDEVGWYSLGPGVGALGNAVLAGHVDWDGRPRTFGSIHLLDEGDVLTVSDADGTDWRYVVVGSRWVRAEGAPVDEIFYPETDHSLLTLITCGGEFRPATREYLDRLIVRARMEMVSRTP
ncbi:MAG: class F sortase [Chloroflexota bacterium]